LSALKTQLSQLV